MRIAFVSIPRFVCAVEASRNPDLARLPLIVGDAEQPKRVLDCSQTGRHVLPGMTIRAALAACPDAVVVPPDKVLYRELWENILLVLGHVAPEVEDGGWGRAYLNVSGLQRHYRDEMVLSHEIAEAVLLASSLVAEVGIAASKFAACAAAMAGSDIVPGGNEAEFLAPMPINLLPVEPEIISRLHLLGLEQIGEVGMLTLPELQSQFGLEGKLLWELANGIDNEPLIPRRYSEPIQTTINLEAPVAGIDVMIALAGQLLSRLKPSLDGRAVRELRLQAELTSGRSWENHVVFKEPVSAIERLAFLLRSSLSNFPPPQAIHSLSLRLENLAGESGKQLSLDGKSRVQQHLEETIRQLKARYGYSPVYRCVDVNPWSVIPEERQILVESDV